MRFACDGCNAKYMISDDKVGPGGVKVRCKKCGHVILVRRPEPEPEGAPGAGEGLGVEWWVAIADQPVGPVTIDVVQHHWDAGEVGPESLVWCAGLAEWSPLSSVPELHAYLMGSVPPPPPEPFGAPTAELEAPPAPREPEPEPEWRPGAASALAALEDSDMNATGGYEPTTSSPLPPAPAAEEPLETLAAGGPVHVRDGVGVGQDPTGVVPLPIQGLERTGEKRIAPTPGPQGQRARRPTTARRPESRSLTVVLVVALAVVAAVAAGLWWLTR
jgi:predicted Zn finger-like uncharacterized protein